MNNSQLASPRKPGWGALENLGGKITNINNADKPLKQIETLKTQNKDMKNELTELKNLNAKLMDRIEVLENEKEDEQLKNDFKVLNATVKYTKNTTMQSLNQSEQLNKLRNKLIDQK